MAYGPHSSREVAIGFTRSGSSKSCSTTPSTGGDSCPSGRASPGPSLPSSGSSSYLASSFYRQQLWSRPIRALSIRGVTTSSASVRGSSRWTSSSSCTPSPPHRSYGRSLGAPVACPSGRGPHNLDLGRRVREPSPPCDDRPCGACCSVARSRVAFLQAASFGVIMEGESLQRLSPEAA